MRNNIKGTDKDITGTPRESNLRAELSDFEKYGSPEAVEAAKLERFNKRNAERDEYRKQQEQEDSYRIAHTAPRVEGSNTLSDFSDVYGDDMYSVQAAQYYGTGNRAMDAETVKILQRYKDNPDADVTIYRAVPKGVTDINEGDWVTVNKNYAKHHGDSWVDDGQYDIIEKKVKAKDVAVSGDSIHEQGYKSLGAGVVGTAGIIGAGISSEDADAGVLSFGAKSVPELANKIKEIDGVKTLNLFETSRGDIKLDTIIIDKDKRKEGIGSRVMDAINDYADMNNQRVTLTPAVADDFQGTTSENRLKKFYKGHGFIENKGRKKDFEISDGMYREPSQKGQVDPRALGLTAAAGGVAAAFMPQDAEASFIGQAARFSDNGNSSLYPTDKQQKHIDAASKYLSRSEPRRKKRESARQSNRLMQEQHAFTRMTNSNNPAAMNDYGQSIQGANSPMSATISEYLARADQSLQGLPGYGIITPDLAAASEYYDKKAYDREDIGVMDYLGALGQ
jgi:GNAT superfamily N-acetyltransferase